MIENQHCHSSTVSQYSATRNTHTHTSDEGPDKMSGGRSDNWLWLKWIYLHRGETERWATSCKCWYVWLYEERERIRASQPAVRYTQKSKQANTHTCVSVYVYGYEERERISVTLVTTAAQGCASDLCMCTNAHVCWYYFANLSTVSVCLPVHTVTQTHTHTHKQHWKHRKIHVK
jgi:hypothetical protein